MRAAAEEGAAEVAGVCPEKEQCSHLKPRVAEAVQISLQKTETGYWSNNC